MLARLSLVKAREGKREQAVELFERLDEAVRQFPGFLSSYIFIDSRDVDFVGRIATWQSEEEMNEAASHDSVAAIRSRIALLVEPDRMEQIVTVMSGVNLPQ